MRFYTITQGRTGSKLLHSSFMKHPQLSVCHEPLIDVYDYYPPEWREIIKKLYKIDLPKRGMTKNKIWATPEYLIEVSKKYHFAKLLY